MGVIVGRLTASNPAGGGSIGFTAATQLAVGSIFPIQQPPGVAAGGQFAARYGDLLIAIGSTQSALTGGRTSFSLTGIGWLTVGSGPTNGGATNCTIATSNVGTAGNLTAIGNGNTASDFVSVFCISSNKPPIIVGGNAESQTQLDGFAPVSVPAGSVALPILGPTVPGNWSYIFFTSPAGTVTGLDSAWWQRDGGSTQFPNEWQRNNPDPDYASFGPVTVASSIHCYGVATAFQDNDIDPLLQWEADMIIDVTRVRPERFAAVYEQGGGIYLS